MAKFNVETQAEIDLLACEYYTAKMVGDIAKKSQCHGEIYMLLGSGYHLLPSLDRYDEKSNYQEPTLYEQEIFTETVFNTLEKFDPTNGSYCHYFNNSFKRKAHNCEIDEYRKHGKHIDYSLDDDKYIGIHIIKDDEYDDPTSEFKIERALEIMIAAIMQEKKRSARSAAQLHFPMIFTDDVARMIHSGLIGKSAIRSNSGHLNSIIHKDFLNYFHNEYCEGIEDCFHVHEKLLEDITGNEKDHGKICRSDKAPYYVWPLVYVKFLVEQVGKSSTESSVSQNIKKYNALMTNLLKSK